MKNKRQYKTSYELFLEADSEDNTQGMSGGDNPTEQDSNMNNPSDDTNPNNNQNDDSDNESGIEEDNGTSDDMNDDFGGDDSDNEESSSDDMNDSSDQSNSNNDEKEKKVKLFKSYMDLIECINEILKLNEFMSFSDLSPEGKKIYGYAEDQLKNALDTLNYIVSNKFQTSSYAQLLRSLLYAKISLKSTVEILRIIKTPEK